MKPSKSTPIIFVVLCAMTVPAMASTKRPEEVCNPLCNDCPSVDELASPGIGLDLTLDYGTAAIKYENGTIIDVGKVNGSEEYRAMMQHFVAMGKCLPDNSYYHQSRYAQFSLKFPEFTDWIMRKYYCFTVPRDLPSNTTINALTNMLHQLGVLLIKHLHSSSYPREFINPLPFPSSLHNTLPEDEKFFPYSVHIVLRNSEIIPDNNIESALHAAGLFSRGFYVNDRVYNTVTCARPSTFADPDFATIIDISNSSPSFLIESKIVLAVEYTASALSLNIFAYDRYKDGSIPNRINDWAGSVSRPDLGASVAGKFPANGFQAYYKDVENFINDTIKQQLPNFPRFPWGYDRIEGLDMSTVAEDNPGVQALLMLGDQPLFRKIGLLEPLQNSLGFNGTVASTLERLDQMDTLYEGARDAASMAKKVSEGWLRFPSKPTCPDTEIVRYYRKHFISHWDNEAETTNTSELIIPDVEGNEEGMVAAIAPGITGQLVRRGLSAAASHYSARDGDNGEIKPSPAALAVLAVTLLVFSFWMFAIQYTYCTVISIIAIVESPQTEVYVQVDSPTDEQPKKLLDSDVVVVNPQPITSKIGTTIEHLRARAGYWSRFRGFSIFVVYAIAQSLIVHLLTVSTITHRPMGHIIATFIADVILCRFEMAWVHIVISEPSPLPWYKRVPGGFKPWKKIVGAAALKSAACNLAIALLAIFACRSSISHLYMAPNTPMTEAQAEQTLLDLAIFLLMCPALILIEAPATVTFVRVAASMLPEQDEPIVPFDRTFDGKLIPEAVGGSGKIGIVDAWRTFDRSSWIRLLKLLGKFFALQEAVTFLFVGVVIGELKLMMGEDFDKLVSAALTKSLKN